ncbi:hypothetical protein K402DRAFT_466116 [Aulographum hederae CBS 113979]|uniref:Uncharacterized protein n=1 Tax=Aulographum hederae CBS 113979 TaxID=1176131 RepID=A0A6G1GRD0_9PEZI|nr:hypothetical protein K402DRAFT_466116 [Aulographum hederae CBS 113979]
MGLKFTQFPLDEPTSPRTSRNPLQREGPNTSEDVPHTSENFDSESDPSSHGSVPLGVPGSQFPPRLDRYFFFSPEPSIPTSSAPLFGPLAPDLPNLAVAAPPGEVLRAPGPAATSPAPVLPSQSTSLPPVPPSSDDQWLEERLETARSGLESVIAQMTTMEGRSLLSDPPPITDQRLQSYEERLENTSLMLQSAMAQLRRLEARRLGQVLSQENVESEPEGLESAAGTWGDTRDEGSAVEGENVRAGPTLQFR